jgi:hypothetical protein
LRPPSVLRIDTPAKILLPAPLHFFALYLSAAAALQFRFIVISSESLLRFNRFRDELLFSLRAFSRRLSHDRRLRAVHRAAVFFFFLLCNVYVFGLG